MLVIVHVKNTRQSQINKKIRKEHTDNLRGSPKIGLHPQAKAIREKSNYKPREKSQNTIEKSRHKLSPTPFPKKQHKTL